MYGHRPDQAIGTVVLFVGAVTLLRCPIWHAPFTVWPKWKFGTTLKPTFVETIGTCRVLYTSNFPGKYRCFGLRSRFGRTLISNAKAPIISFDFCEFGFDFFPLPGFKRFFRFSFQPF